MLNSLCVGRSYYFCIVLIPPRGIPQPSGFLHIDPQLLVAVCDKALNKRLDSGVVIFLLDSPKKGLANDTLA